MNNNNLKQNKMKAKFTNLIISSLPVIISLVLSAILANFIHTGFGYASDFFWSFMMLLIPVVLVFVGVITYKSIK